MSNYINIIDQKRKWKKMLNINYLFNCHLIQLKKYIKLIQIKKNLHFILYK